MPDILKCIIAAHTKLFISFFVRKPSTKIADVGKLLWAQMSYGLYMDVSVPFNCQKTLLVSFIDIDDLCTL